MHPDIERALQHQDEGRPQQAEQLLFAVIDKAPRDVDAHYHLAILYHQYGEQQRAAARAQQAVALAHDRVDVLYNCATILREAGQQTEAAAVYERALQVDPLHRGTLNNLGLLYLDLREYDNAARVLGQTVNAYPDDKHSLLDLADCEVVRTNYDIAMQCYERAIALDENDARVYRCKGALLAIQLQVEEALACFRRSLALDDKDPETWIHQGRARMALGEFAEAESDFRTALRLQPDQAEAHRHLAGLVRHSGYDDDMRAMEAILERGAKDDWSRMSLHFGLADAYDNIGEVETSFSHLLEANRLHRQSLDFSIDEQARLCQRTREVFSREFIDAQLRPAGHIPPPEMPVMFVLGMPRSGTSLTEQIIASHSSATGVGEIDDLGLFARKLARQSAVSYPDCVLSIDAERWQELAREYWQGLARFEVAQGYIVDKSLPNFLHIGFILALFPHARIIHCRRDPLANCFSIFSKTFEGSAFGYAYDMTEIGQYYRLYETLMAHWESVFPGRIHTLDYEALVANSDAEIAALLAYCGLEPERACFEFYNTDRVVRTNSFDQVRQPLYKKANTRLDSYRRYLGPLQDALGGTPRQ